MKSMNSDSRIRRMLRRDGVVGGVGDCGLLAGDPQPPLIVRWWRRLWAKLDAGQVGPLQFAVHFAVGLAGVVGLINSGHTPQDVEDALGGSANAMWLWLCIGGWLSPLGILLRGKGRYVGYWLSLAGDTFVTGVFAVYAFAVIDNRRGSLTAAYTSFPFLLLAALTVTTGLLAVDDVRRILAVEHRLRAEN